MSSSEPSVSTSAPQTASAASSVQPPANAARRANSCCSGSSSRSWLQAIVARRVRCRSGASRAPPVSSGSRCSSRSSSFAGGEHLHARRGELDRQRQPVEPRADRLDARTVAVELEAGPLGEQDHRLGCYERRHRILALGADPERLAAGREKIDACKLGRKLRDHPRHLGEQLLEIVEHEQQPPRAQVVPEQVSIRPAAPLAQAERLRDPSHDEIHVRNRREPHEPDAVDVVLRHFGGGLHHQTCLAAAAGAGERDDRDIFAAEQLEQVLDLALAADELRRRDRQVRLVQRLERRKRVRAELVQPLRLGQVFQSVLTEVAHEHPLVEQRPRRLAQQHLAAVSSGHHPRRAVHVEPDVLGRVEDRLSRVDPHPDPDRPALERAHRLLDGRDRRPGGRKRVEEGVALLVDLVAGRERLAHDPAMLGQGVAVSLLAELAQETRRPLDIGEDERDRARRLLSHGGIFRRHEGRCNQRTRYYRVAVTPEWAERQDARPTDAGLTAAGAATATQR